MSMRASITAIPTGIHMDDYDFLFTALTGAGLVAVVAACIGYFLVLRSQSFAGHALSHVGFAGATGAVLVGLSPFWGLILFTGLAGLAMGALSEKLAGRDIAIGMILSLALGLGLLFLHFYTAFATQVSALLFGNVLGIDPAMLWPLILITILVLSALGLMARPLIFASLQPELAEARGVPLKTVSMLFLGLSGLAIALSTQIVGMLLVFTLLIGPAASAQRLTCHIRSGLWLSVIFALLIAWGGIGLAIITDWPVSFCITALSGAVYGLSLLKS